jgi:addiction module HigA family antidote
MDKQDLLAISRKPTHPGEMLREEFLPDYEMSVAQLAEKLHVSRQSVNELVRERRAVSAEMALKLARVFNTTPQYWVNLQRNIDLWNSLALHEEEIMSLEPLPVQALS